MRPERRAAARARGRCASQLELLSHLEHLRAHLGGQRRVGIPFEQFLVELEGLVGPCPIADRLVPRELQSAAGASRLFEEVSATASACVIAAVA